MTRGLKFLSMAFLLSACGETAVDIEAEKAALMDRSRAWSDEVATGDIDTLITFWAEDAVMMPPDSPPLRGRAAIRDYVEGAMAIPGFKISWEPISAHISRSGDMGYLIERNVTEFLGEDGEPVVEHGKVTTVWRKSPDGQWVNVVDMWNAAPPPEGNEGP